MKAEERENKRYSSGIVPKIDMEESIMLKLLSKESPSGLSLISFHYLLRL